MNILMANKLTAERKSCDLCSVVTLELKKNAQTIQLSAQVTQNFEGTWLSDLHFNSDMQE
jgi:hypothetical protein